MRWISTVTALVCLAIGSYGCGGAVSGVPVAQPASGQSAGPGEEWERGYRLERGDTLDIRFFYNPELNDTVVIRPDGRVALQLIGEVRADGLTPQGLVDVLRQSYAGVLRHPEVTVNVKSFSSQRVFVGGEVNQPGVIPLAGRLTTLQAILQAGGVKESAELGSVVILRNQGTQSPAFMTVDLTKDLDRLTGHNDILLEPYDVVFVPKTVIARMNQFVEQYIDRLIPVSRMVGFSWVYNLKPEVQVR